MTDTQRIDKLERMQRSRAEFLDFRFTGYHVTRSGHMILNPVSGSKHYKTLREAIDAAPEPKRQKKSKP